MTCRPGRESLVISDTELYQRARNVLQPRKLSAHASAGGVASALVSSQGNVYVGVCIETDCQMGFCAEHNAIGSMVTHGESRIETIVAVDVAGRVLAPCGRCREFIYQMDPGNMRTRVLLGDDRILTVEALLPVHWAGKG